MKQDEIVELAIQGHASTRDAIRWAIKQERERIITLLKSLGTNTNEDGGEDEPTRDDCIFSIKGES